MNRKTPFTASVCLDTLIVHPPIGPVNLCCTQSHRRTDVKRKPPPVGGGRGRWRARLGGVAPAFNETITASHSIKYEFFVNVRVFGFTLAQSRDIIPLHK